MKRAIKPGDN